MPDTNRLDDWIDIYLKECELLRGCSPNTMRAYRKVLRLWPHYGYGLHPDSAKLAAMKLREQGKSPVTVNSYLRIIRIFWNWLHKRGVLDAAPKVPRLPEPKKVKAVFSSSQALAVLNAKPEHAAVKRAQAIFAVGIDTGLRFGELVSLRRSDIDAQSMLLTVRGKVGERRVPISSTALRWINRHLQSHRFDHVFCSSVGTLWECHNAQRELKTLFELAGVPVELAQFHHIRRYALRKYISVAGLRGAQLLAGHARPETTILYLDAELRALPHQSMSPLVRLGGYKR